MAKKVILKDLYNVEMLPITRGELILDSSGYLAFHSSQFLATQSLPGLMSGEDKTKLDSLEKVNVEDRKVLQVNTTTDANYRLLFSNSADDETKTEGAQKSAKLLFNPSTGTLIATSLIGKLDWSNLNGIPEKFTPEQHIHNTSEITALFNYSKAISEEDLIATDTLNLALGKLEYKADTAYNWIMSVTAADTDEYINKWQEILDFLKNIDNTDDTDIIDEFVTRKTPQTITGEKIFSGTSASLLTIDRNSNHPAWIKFAKNNSLLGYIGINNTKIPVVNIDTHTYYILHSGNSHIKDGVITINNQTITPITSHQSLANYVTLNSALTISGVKTFSKLLKFTVATGTSPFTVSSTTKVTNLNADRVDDYHISTAGTTKPWGTIVTIGSDGVSEMGRYIDFHYDNTTGSDYSTRLLCGGNHSNVVTLPSATGTLAITSLIPSVTDYYWANVKVSSTRSTTTTPTFSNTTINGTLTMGGAINTNSTAGTWVSGMSGAAILYNKLTAIDSTSFWRFFNMKSSGGHVVCYGGLGNDIGFYGYYSGRTANGTDWRFTVNTANGNWTATASMYAAHFYENSDIQLKTNIQKILNSYKMPIIKEFDWKEDGSHSYGLIAQELEEQGYSELVSIKDDGYKTVNYSAALSLIVGKLQVKIKELEKEIENLKNKN